MVNLQYFEAMAAQNGVNLHQRYNPTQAAKLIGISAATLSRVKIAGKIGYVEITPRKVQYFGHHIIQYLVDSTCPANNNGSTKSENGGYGTEKAPGAAAEITHRPDKSSELAYAQAIFQKPSAH